MSVVIDRAWLFELPSGVLASEPSSRSRGLVVNATGAIAMAEDSHAVRQSILLLLSTRPGERVMRADYGCWLHRLVFAPNDASTAGLAIHYVGEALRRWEPRVRIQRLDAGADLHGTGDATVLDIVLEYQVRRTGWIDRMSLGYDLQRGRLMEPGSSEPRQGGLGA